MGFNHSGQIHARNHERITRILYLISTLWHLPPHFLVFSSFLDLTLTSHVTHKYVFLRKRKITFTDIFEVANFQLLLIGSGKFSQSYDHYKILCKLARLRPCLLTCLRKNCNYLGTTTFYSNNSKLLSELSQM